ncbi:MULTISPECIES: glutamine amidotransferase [Comamonas]|uniref:glutamine amidotransferase n=1 Tax=Comamonas TaxID=283 RepID=UPI001E3646F0|nr:MULTISPECIES: glutamine amidotransferase [Comamonas]UNV92102.1 glutamine amidotransferase [Comamonas sp. 7D-2evo1]UNV94599.1 glutamine amidotransferase [Comamonas sp. 7D-2]UNW01738.1 glutamine amidotransferase [Comamonas sp. 7D-2evo2]BDB71308.1 GMP synthase [Comamonas thiooxydans]
MDFQSLLLIQAGTPPDDIRAIAGDLPQWFLAAIGCESETIDIVKVYEGAPLPKPGQHRAAIITGSWSMVTDQLPWSEATAMWIRYAVTQGMPLMGVCYGHQLMAHALGGTVDYHPDGREMGSLEIELHAEAALDPWLTGSPPRFHAQLTHLQTILHLPAGAIALARSAHDPHQIVRYSPTAVSMQFHPEFTPEVMAACINARAPVLRSEGLDPTAMLQSVRPTPTPLALLKRFIESYMPPVSGEPATVLPNLLMVGHPKLPQGTLK